MLSIPIPSWFLPNAPPLLRRVAFGVSIGVILVAVGYLLIALKI